MTNLQVIRDDKRRLEIFYDDDCMTPREWDNLGTIVTFHRKYYLGDYHRAYRSGDYSSWHELKKAICKDNDIAVILPLYLYDHGGITISTKPFSCPWDSGQIGFIFATKEDIRKEYEIKRVSKQYIEKTKKILLGEVDVYDDYLRGEVFGFRLFDNDTLVEACGGFYGSDIKNNLVGHLPKEHEDLLEKIA